MNDLGQVAVFGFGLISGSISLVILRSFTRVKVIDYTQKVPTQNKAGQIAVAGEKQADDAD